MFAGYNFSDQFITWSLLACISAILERRSYFNAQGFGYIFPNIYVVLVGPPASGKTTIADRATEWLLENLDNGPMFASNVATPAALVDELKEAEVKKGFAHGHSPLFVYSSELGVFLDDIGGGEPYKLLIDWFDGRRHGKVWSKHVVKKGKRLEILSPSLTLLGCTTSDWLQRSRIAEVAGQGFTSRVIWVHEPKFSPRVSRPPAIDEALKSELQREMVRINAISGEFIFMNGAQAAIDRLTEEGNEWGKKHSGSTLLAHYYSRKILNIRKVSMLLSALRSSDRIIKGVDVETAAALFSRLEPNYLSAFGLRITYRDESLAGKIMARLTGGGWISEAALMESFYHDGQALTLNELKDVLLGLHRMGLLQARDDSGKLHYRRLME